MKKFLPCLLNVFILAGVLFVTGCNNGGGSDITPVNIASADLLGYWDTTIPYGGKIYDTYINIYNSTNWTISIPGLSYSDSGTYTLSGGVATLTCYFNGGRYAGTYQVIGTGTYIGDNKVFLELNSKADMPGTFTLQKR
jgi:hypothetical protein